MKTLHGAFFLTSRFTAPMQGSRRSRKVELSGTSLRHGDSAVKRSSFIWDSIPSSPCRAIEVNLSRLMRSSGPMCSRAIRESRSAWRINGNRTGVFLGNCSTRFHILAWACVWMSRTRTFMVTSVLRHGSGVWLRMFRTCTGTIIGEIATIICRLAQEISIGLSISRCLPGLEDRERDAGDARTRLTSTQPFFP